MTAPLTAPLTATNARRESPNYAPLRERMARGGTVVLDGGIGTGILRRDITWADHQVLGPVRR